VTTEGQRNARRKWRASHPQAWAAIAKRARQTYYAKNLAKGLTVDGKPRKRPIALKNADSTLTEGPRSGDRLRPL
jgi:hypothetical protein